MRQLRYLVFLSIFLPVLLLCAIGWATWSSRQAEMRRTVQYTLDLVHEHALKTFDTFSLVAEQVNEIVRDLDDDEIRANAMTIHQRLQRLEQSLPQVQDIWVIDAQARASATASLYPAPAVSLADRQYFSAVQDPNRPVFISELLRGRASDAVFFQMSWRRATPDGRFRGVTAVSVEPDYFRDFHGRVAGPEGLAISLVREDGALLVRYPTRSAELADRALKSDNFGAQVAQAPGQGLFKSVSSLDGERRLVAYRRIGNYPLYVTAAISIRSAVYEWMKDILGYVALGIPATLGLFFLSLKALRHMQSESASLLQLKEEAQRREAAEATLRQVQKMEAVGRITGGVAHDFNNLLTVVIGNLDVLMRRLAKDDVRARRSASLAKEGAVRASLLTQRLLAFSRQQPLQPSRVDINGLVTGMSDLTRRTLGETITVSCLTMPGLWPVDVDPNQLENAILNLAVNARDAMPDGGVLTIETANERVAAQGPHPDDPVPGDYVLIRVSDTGSGIGEEIQQKVFEPFFTTKPHGQGTGLGLSQVYGFIKQSGGQVRLDSAPGRGTVVRLYLPRARTAASEATRAELADAAPLLKASAAKRTALVVEDEASVRAFSCEALRDLGFEVIQVGDAAAALATLAERADIDLLFSDIGLPGMDGRALAASVRAKRPGLPILLTSGYAHQILREPDEHGFELLPKPFTIDELSRKLAILFRAQPVRT